MRRSLSLITVLGLVACGGDATGPVASRSGGQGCGAVGATALAVGQVVAPLPGTSLCVSGGTAGGEFALVAFNGSTVAGGATSITVQPDGVRPVASSLLTDRASVTGAPVATLLPARTRDASVHARLRARAARVLAPLIPAARRALAGRRDVIPSAPVVGQLLRLNANADSVCNSPVYRTGRVVAITQSAVVVADTGNPKGGFTDADYASMGITFDTLVNPLDTRNFGQPTDIDGNRGVVLFFTRVVNEQTPPHSASYIAGFFLARDLFPPAGTKDFEACPSSNHGEMVYLMVPDTRGEVNGNVFSKSDVVDASIATLAHEHQHLINASRRMYVNTSAQDFEDVWLDEGLSHVAEELLFYAESGLQPRQDLGWGTVRATARVLAAFMNDQYDNMSRLAEFLARSGSASPYAGDDELWTRGATWSFLRYAVDHQPAAEAGVWYQLVNSTTSGQANLRQVLGATAVPALFRDWATSLIADGQPGVDARFQQPSWQMRSIFDALQGSLPLRTVSLADGAPATVTVIGGGAAYLRFAVGAGKAASLAWGTVPSGVQLTIVRLK